MDEKTKRRMRRRMSFRRKHRLRQLMQNAGWPSDTKIKPQQFLNEMSPRRKKYLKKISNKKVRKNSTIGKGSTYKRYFDLQWELW